MENSSITLSLSLLQLEQCPKCCSGVNETKTFLIVSVVHVLSPVGDIKPINGFSALRLLQFICLWTSVVSKLKADFKCCLIARIFAEQLIRSAEHGEMQKSNQFFDRRFINFLSASAGISGFFSNEA